MNKNSFHSSAGYSIVLSLVMIGFLLVLTTGTLNLVLQEMQDGKGKQDYLKSYAGAEGALEIALLQIKEGGYGYYDTKANLQVLGDGPKDARIGYQFEGKVSVYSGVLQPYETHIIPLFWIDKQKNFFDAQEINFLTNGDMNWNLISNGAGISGTGSFSPITSTGIKELVEVGGNLDFSFIENITTQNFLSSHTGAYLAVYNSDSVTQNYTLRSSSGSFTEPKSIIRSSAGVGKYKQNLETLVDNTEFLGILKYSIYFE